MALAAGAADVVLELRDADDVEAWLCGGLCLARIGERDAAALSRAGAWTAALIGETPQLPPAGVVADIGALLSGSPLDATAALPVQAPRLDAALRGYEDHVLGRLVADRRFEAVADALARLPDDRRPLGVALVVEHLLERLGHPALLSVNPGVARRMLSRPGEELLERGMGEAVALTAATAEPEPGSLLELLVDGYEALVQSARRARQLLDDRDAFVLEHLDVLRGRAERLAVEQVVEVAEALERAVPKRVRAPARRGPTPTTIADESAYPTGGFSSISNMGSMENLVSSELVYMERSDEVDLFDVRYAEGELLYYTRDESVMVRQRHVLTIGLMPDLTRARFKDADMPTQRIVAVLGFLLCAVRRLSDWLSDDALTIRVVFIGHAAEHAALGAERELTRLLLREWIDKDVVSVSAQTLDEAIDFVLTASKGATADLMLISAGEQTPALPPDPALSWLILDASEARPKIHLPPRRARDLRIGPPAQDAWQAWREATRALLPLLL
ncbi:MAG: hypothetical protein KC503_20345 [Myxococcales bacterium]|nr:hypothetical protein [Myxococcales bacterium]